MRDLATGLLSALLVATLGWLAIRNGISSRGAEDSARDLGVILTLVFGIVSAVWWHQSARMANELIDDNAIDKERAKQANTLSGAAATATALALIASVFTGLRWRSPESWLCALGLILLIAMSGDDIRQATATSLREGMTLRSGLGLLVLAILIAVFVYDRIGA